jgi:hypothetical protein
MRRFTPRPRAAPIDNCQIAVRPADPSKERNNKRLAGLEMADLESGASRRKFAVRIQRLQKIGSRSDRIGQPDPQRARGQRRRDRGDRLGLLLAAGLLNRTTFADHQIPICRRDYAVLWFNEIDD